MFCMLRECSEKASWSRASKGEGGRGQRPVKLPIMWSHIGLVETIKAVTKSELGGHSPPGRLHNLSKFPELKRSQDRTQVSPVLKLVLSLGCHPSSRRKENQKQPLS